MGDPPGGRSIKEGLPRVWQIAGRNPFRLSNQANTTPYGTEAVARVERAIMFLTALKPDRMGAERARLLNKEQRRPFVVTQSVRDQISCVIYTTN